MKTGFSSICPASGSGRKKVKRINENLGVLRGFGPLCEVGGGSGPIA